MILRKWVVESWKMVLLFPSVVYAPFIVLILMPLTIMIQLKDDIKRWLE